MRLDRLQEVCAHLYTDIRVCACEHEYTVTSKFTFVKQVRFFEGAVAFCDGGATSALSHLSFMNYFYECFFVTILSSRLLAN